MYCSFNTCLVNRKANNLFEKNAAPILHLAGVEVNIVKVLISYILPLNFSLYPFPFPFPCCQLTHYFLLQTDYEGQAKKLMELMEQTDMLIVAGGDGTLQEVTVFLV